jgi:hypothetical protein
MAAVDDLDQVIERYQRALNELLKGNPEPNKAMFSHREYVTILNPIGSLAHGWEQVSATMEGVASQVSDGEITSFDTLEKYVTPRACLRCVGRAEQGKGRRKAGYRAIRSAGYADPSTRRGYLEGRASACRLGNHGSANRSGIEGVDLPLAHFRELSLSVIAEKTPSRKVGE